MHFTHRLLHRQKSLGSRRIVGTRSKDAGNLLKSVTLENPGSLKLRMVSWNLKTLLVEEGDSTPQLSDKVIGSLGSGFV